MIELRGTATKREVTGRLRLQRQEIASAACLALSLLAALLRASPSAATHEVNHRYLVLGYVRDGAGRPLPGLMVRVVREKTGLAYQAKSDAEGFYLVVVHLHDGDLGESLLATAGPATIRVRASFDPRDAKSHRGTRIDFSGGRVWEHREDFAWTLREYLKQ